MRLSVLQAIVALLLPGILQSTSFAVGDETSGTVETVNFPATLPDSSLITGNVRRHNNSVISCIEQDPAPEPFFAGPVPRTQSICEDRSLFDVTSVGKYCWAVGQRGVILISQDSGLTWQSVVLPFECSLRSVCFLTSQTGFVAGAVFDRDNSIWRGIVLKTTNGGTEWKLLTTTTANSDRDDTNAGIDVNASFELPPVNTIRFFDLHSAIAICCRANADGAAPRSTVVRTDDGGATWKPIASDQRDVCWRNGCFLSASDGVVVGSHQSMGAVIGNQIVTLATPSQTLRGAAAVELSTSGLGWVVGDAGLILHSNNGGISWKPPEYTFPPELKDIFDFRTIAMSDQTVCIAGHPGSCVLHSGDGGKSWNLSRLASTLPVNRLRSISPEVFLAVGDMGIIHRSDDGGRTWVTVRNPENRAAILSLVSSPDCTSPELLAQYCGNDGFRSVVLQASRPVSEAAIHEGFTTDALGLVGVNAFATDWMFPRDAPLQELVRDELMKTWQRQTDDRLQELLPQRLAQHIRVWRPDVICIDRESTQDQVAAIWLEVIHDAIRIAAGEAERGQILDAVCLEPWTVSRVFARLNHGDQTALSVDGDMLLKSLGTTTALVTDDCRQMLMSMAPAGNVRREAAMAAWQLVTQAGSQGTPAGLFAGMNVPYGSASRRTYSSLGEHSPESMVQILDRAQAEAAALTGHLALRGVPLSLIADLRNIGRDLPSTLALKQMENLLQRYEDVENVEGQIAVQREIINRFPESAAAIKAAENLFQYYSSEELRALRRMQELETSNLPSQDIQQASAQIPGLPPGMGVQVRQATGRTFENSRGSHRNAVDETWDLNAEKAFGFLAEHAPQRAESSQVLLRKAANVRRQNTFGETSTILSQAAQGDDLFAVLAQAEQQAAFGAAQALIPVINLPAAITADSKTKSLEKIRPPVLDGNLSDECWHSSPEIHLATIASTIEHVDSDCLIQLAWDSEHLYICGRVERAAANDLKPDPLADRHHDADHGRNDRLTLMVDTDRDFTTGFEFSIDEAGNVGDRCWKSTHWNPQWYVANDADEHVWRFEAAIPFSEFASRPVRPGELWAIRLQRIVPGVLQQELRNTPQEDANVSITATTDTQGYGMLRFIRDRD
ncbi:MAG: hypothetical protein KDA81_19495 [Planctomycetaceae bacterium]|nr:hypothetical protein [Planctomycetaceae bacterium]